MGKIFVHHFCHAHVKVDAIEKYFVLLVLLLLLLLICFHTNGTMTVGTRTSGGPTLFKPMEMELIFTTKSTFAVLTTHKNNSFFHLDYLTVEQKLTLFFFL
jgi:hypothetical protein